MAQVVKNRQSSHNLPYEAIAPSSGLILNKILNLSSCFIVSMIYFDYCIKYVNFDLILSRLTSSWKVTLRSLGN